MYADEQNPWTARHQQSPLILIEVSKKSRTNEVALRNDGRLAALPLQSLDVLRLPQPIEMTGHSLLKPAEYEVRSYSHSCGQLGE